MSPELREFVLSLPLDVRRELAKCEGPAWYLASSDKFGGEGVCERADTVRAVVTDTHFWGRTAWLPVSPIAIALHAAKLSGRDGSHFVGVTVAPCYDFGGSGAELSTGRSWRDRANVLAEYMADDDTAKDPTGHRGAIALLQKVMDERKVPNAEP